jgi:hypothetical protein
VAAPAQYTEETFILYIRDGVFRRKVADILRWDLTTNYQEIVDQTLLDYGVATIEEALNIPKLRALGRMNAWKAVMEANVPAYQATADGATFHRDQIYDHARQQYNEAVSDASPFLNRVQRTVPADIALTW